MCLFVTPNLTNQSQSSIRLLFWAEEMLRETLQQRKRIAQESSMYSLQVHFDEGFEVICKQCGFHLAPLHAASHYINVDINKYRYGNHLLLMDLYEYPSLNIEH